MADDFGSVGKVSVDVVADLSALSAQMTAAVPQANQIGAQVGTGLSSGVQSGVAGAVGALGQLDTELQSTAAQASAAASQMDVSFAGASGNIVNSLRSIGRDALGVGAALSAGVTLPLAALGTAAIASFANIDSLNRSLITIAGSAAGAAQQFQDLRTVALLPGLGLTEAVQGSVRLQAFGFSATEAKDALLGFGNAIASVGGGKAELDRVILQLGQMAGAGKILTQDLRPILQTVPQVGSILVQQLGQGALNEPQKALEKLGLSSKQYITDMLVPALLQLPQVTGGIKNDLENFSDSSKIALAKVGEAMEPLVHIIVESVVPAMNGAVAVLSALGPVTQSVIVAIAGTAAAVGPLVAGFGLLSRSVGGIVDIYNKYTVATEAGTAAAAANTVAEVENAAAQEATATAAGVNAEAMTAEAIATGEATIATEAGTAAAVASGAAMGALDIAFAALAGGSVLAAVAVLGDVVLKMNEMPPTLKEMQDALQAAGISVYQFGDDVQTTTQKVTSAFRNMKESVGTMGNGQQGFLSWLGIGSDVGLGPQDAAIANLKSQLDLLHITVDRGKMSFAQYMDAMRAALNQVQATAVGYSSSTKAVIESAKQLEDNYENAQTAVLELTAAQNSGKSVTAELAEANRQLTAAYKALYPEAKNVKDSIADIAAQAAKYQTEIKNAQLAVEKFTKDQAEGKDVSAELGLAYRDLGKAYDELYGKAAKASAGQVSLLDTFKAIVVGSQQAGTAAESLTKMMNGIGKEQPTQVHGLTVLYSGLTDAIDTTTKAAGDAVVTSENYVSVIRETKGAQQDFSDTVDRTSISIGGFTSYLEKGSAGLVSFGADLQRGVASVNDYSKATQAIVDSVQASEQKFKDAKASVSELTAAQNSGQNVTAELAEANRRLQQAYQALSPEERKAIDANSQAGSSMSAAAVEADQLAEAVKAASDAYDALQLSANSIKGMNLGGSEVFGAGMGGAAGISGNTGTDLAHANVGDIKSIPGIVNGLGGGSSGAQTWSAEEIAFRDLTNTAISSLESAGFSASQVDKLLTQMRNTGQTIDQVIAQWTALGKAVTETTASVADAGKIAGAAAPAMSDLSDQLDALINAGQGNTTTAKALFTQLESMDTAYSDSAASANQAAAAVNDTRSSLTQLASTAVSVSSVIVDSLGRVLAAENATLSALSGPNTGPSAPTGQAAQNATTSSLGQTSPTGTTPLNSSGVIPGTYSPDPIFNPISSPAVGPTDTTQGYFVNGGDILDPLSAAAAPSYTAPTTSQMPSTWAGVSPIWIAVNVATPTADAVGKAVTDILVQRGAIQ